MDHRSRLSRRVSRIESESFQNPIVSHGADPWVVERAGYYHYCFSDARSAVFVAVARRLEEIGQVPAVMVWSGTPGTAFSRQVWAPELHFLDGRWYIYVAASDGQNVNHRMIVLESETDDAQGVFHQRGVISAYTDRWAIDGTVLDWQGERYFLWSGWDGTQNNQQNIYISKMISPMDLLKPQGDVVRLEPAAAALQYVRRRVLTEAPFGQCLEQMALNEATAAFTFHVADAGLYQLDIFYSTPIACQQNLDLGQNRKVFLCYEPCQVAGDWQTHQVIVALEAGPTTLTFGSSLSMLRLGGVEIKPHGTDRIVLSRPTEHWEKQGGPPYVNEGPQVLIRGDQLHVIYSASGSWTDDYLLGQLSFQGGDLLDKNNWRKKGPVFARHGDAYGPGHACFVKSLDGTEDWIVYHTAKNKGTGWRRHIRMQTFSWNEVGEPQFGEPWPLQQRIKRPSVARERELGQHRGA